MWTNKDREMTEDFNTAFRLSHENGHAKGELANLAKLFSDEALSLYAQALHNGLQPGSEAWADVAWIDKRPIARLAKKGVGAELGDMLLIVNHIDPAGPVSSRACILEVKKSDSEAIKPVPVTTGKSTKNQFAILSSWPTIYELAATGNSRSDLLMNIVTNDDSSLDVLAQAWYAVVRPLSSEKHHWMAAPAIKGASFAHSLGDLFTACCRARSLCVSDSGRSLEVGRYFKPDLTLNEPPNWDSLVNKILSVADRYDLPQSYFKGYASGRRRSTRAGLPAISIATASPELWHESLLSLGLTCITFILILGILSIQILSLRTRYGEMHRRKRRGKFPVLTLTCVHSEYFEPQREQVQR